MLYLLCRSYISRALSYEGAEFSMVRVEIDPKFK